MFKEATASAFVLSRFDRVAQVALVWHRLQAWLPAGGHVEIYENPAEAALREIIEETGLVASLIPGPALALPAGFPQSASSRSRVWRLDRLRDERVPESA
ncbi:NUDIX domain-containing protein [Sphaerisporangium viridialbum]|uniref:NUDIX domain-containing protein n=1 Tax=Sphaerisporangium viridialbum TaxID=46189 RepID=UPI003C74BCCE